MFHVTVESAAMDRPDRVILAAVAASGRVTLQELAEPVHLGPSATRDRLRRLEQRGVITGYRAILDEDALGYPLEALVEVDLAPGADMQKFERGSTPGRRWSRRCMPPASTTISCACGVPIPMSYIAAYAASRPNSAPCVRSLRSSLTAPYPLGRGCRDSQGLG